MSTGVLRRPGAEIYYEVAGSGPAIVFAHGLGGNHLSWWQQIAYFARQYTCVTFAHRGFAPSVTGAEPDAWDPSHYADDLEALIAHLDLTDVCLVAQSMGGWSSIEYALRHPSRVRRLVLSATSGTFDLSTLEPPAGSAMEQWYADHAPINMDLFRRGIHPAAGERMVREQPALHLLYREIDLLSARVDKFALREKLAAMRTVPVSRLRELTMPVLFVAGDEDVVFPPEAASALAAIAPHGELEVVPESGHSVYFERAALFNERVGSFLR
jgi:pimeloyl-ACP methyl ester carboxylesterase